tara:strand:- start:1294 stop:1506 length:213 start_codon:yes stop_codon:yes gene_type:complete
VTIVAAAAPLAAAPLAALQAAALLGLAVTRPALTTAHYTVLMLPQARRKQPQKPLVTPLVVIVVAVTATV